MQKNKALGLIFFVDYFFYSSGQFGRVRTS